MISSIGSPVGFRKGEFLKICKGEFLKIGICRFEENPENSQGKWQQWMITFYSQQYTHPRAAFGSGVFSHGQCYREGTANTSQ